MYPHPHPPTQPHPLGRYPVVLITIFNVADWAGKSTPGIEALRLRNEQAILGAALARVLLVPAFHLAGGAEIRDSCVAAGHPPRQLGRSLGSWLGWCLPLMRWRGSRQRVRLSSRPS